LVLLAVWQLEELTYVGGIRESMGTQLLSRLEAAHRPVRSSLPPNDASPCHLFTSLS